ncbi:guanine nucleotide binding protein, alpha subunit, partial [Gorgonomyces haynaldii]
MSQNNALEGSIPSLDPAFDPSSPDYDTPRARQKRKQLSKEIDKQLTQEERERQQKKRYTVLLLGAGDSGKSTFLKQLILVHGKGFTLQERIEFRYYILNNLVNSLRTIIDQIEHTGGSVKMDRKQLQRFQKFEVERNEVLPQDIVSSIWNLKGDEAVLKAIDDPTFYKDDTFSFFFNKLESVLKPMFTPSDEDVLNCRRVTEQITETFFEIKDAVWSMVDVSGQRDKRSRWTHYFDKNVSGVIFLVSCVGYCQVLAEDPTVNRMDDALELFTQLTHNTILKLDSIIVLLNKIDLLEERLQKYPIKQHYPKYLGQNDKKSWLEYLATEFEEAADPTRVRTRTFKTQATDTNLMKKIIVSVQQCVVERTTAEIGLA